MPSPLSSSHFSTYSGSNNSIPGYSGHCKEYGRFIKEAVMCSRYALAKEY